MHVGYKNVPHATHDLVGESGIVPERPDRRGQDIRRVPKSQAVCTTSRNRGMQKSAQTRVRLWLGGEGWWGAGDEHKGAAPFISCHTA